MGTRRDGPVECVEFVEQLQMERRSGLAVDFATGPGLHGHRLVDLPEDAFINRVDCSEWISSSTFFFNRDGKLS